MTRSWCPEQRRILTSTSSRISYYAPNSTEMTSIVSRISVSESTGKCRLSTLKRGGEKEHSVLLSIATPSPFHLLLLLGWSRQQTLRKRSPYRQKRLKNLASQSQYDLAIPPSTGTFRPRRSARRKSNGGVTTTDVLLAELPDHHIVNCPSRKEWPFEHDCAVRGTATVEEGKEGSP